MRGHFRSRDKDGVTPFDPPLPKTPCYTQTSWFYVLWNRAGYCRSKFEREDWDFGLFCSRDLDLGPMTFIYELDRYSLEMYRMCKN